MRQSRGVLAVLAGLSSFPASASAGMCALCRQTLVSGGHHGLIQGFYWSILLIAGVPLILMGAAGFFAWRQWRGRQVPRV